MTSLRRSFLFFLVTFLVALSGCFQPNPVDAKTARPDSHTAQNVAAAPADPLNEKPAGPAAKVQAKTLETSTPTTNASVNKTWRPRSVVMVDEPVNVYHQAFRRPGWVAHPSTVIPGYPADARPLHLTFDVQYPKDGFVADADTWASMEEDVLYYIPGTNIIGLTITTDQTVPEYPPEAFSHGTGVAGNLAGAHHGASPDTGIMIRLPDDDRWSTFALENPWIDAVTLSHVTLQPSPPGLRWEEHERLLVENGTLVFQAAWNNPVWTCPNPFCQDNPPWTVTVGQVRNERVYGHGPLDIASEPAPCPHHEYMKVYDDRCAGTSFATPFVAGRAAALLGEVRDMWGWTDCQGNAMACTAAAPLRPPDGPLSDGELHNQEILELLYRSAELAPREPYGRLGFETIPGTGYTDQGWGALDGEGFEVARAALMGAPLPPVDENAEKWWLFHRGIRESYWDTGMDGWRTMCDTTSYC